MAKTISMMDAFFNPRPFGKKVEYPWKIKGTTTDKAVDAFFKFGMRPYHMAAIYSSSGKPTKKETRKARQEAKLRSMPKFGDYILRQKGVKKWGIVGGSAGFIFAPQPLIGMVGGYMGGLGIYTLKHPQLIKQYRQEMWKKYRVKKKHLWQY